MFDQKEWLFDVRKYRYTAYVIDTMKEAVSIFREVYGCHPFYYINKLMAGGFPDRKAIDNVLKKLSRIEGERVGRIRREARKEYQIRHNGGFYAADDSDDVPFS